MPPANCQLKLMALAEEVLVNCTGSGPQPVVLEAVNPALGGVAMVTVRVVVLEPQVLVAVKVTV